MEKEQFLIVLKKEIYAAGTVYDKLVIDRIKKHNYHFLTLEMRERLYKICNDITDIYEEFKLITQE